MQKSVLILDVSAQSKFESLTLVMQSMDLVDVSLCTQAL